MSAPIQTICNLTDCSIEEAILAYAETKDVTDAVDKLLIKVINKSDKYLNKPKVEQHLTEEQVEIANVRKLMKENDDRMYSFKPIESNPPEFVESNVMPFHREETVLQNNYSQECQLPSQLSVAETPETVCQLQSESTCDLQSSGQT